jgi:hypothetical protein
LARRPKDFPPLDNPRAIGGSKEARALYEDPRLRDAAIAELHLLQDVFTGKRYRFASNFRPKLSDPLDPIVCGVLAASTIVQPEKHNSEDVAIIVDAEVSIHGLPEDALVETKERRCLAHVVGFATYRDGTYTNLWYTGANVAKLLPYPS